ncbi:hypothetical protein HY992_02270 [Candidatus Micrarchaeota archaeon]|nr:hypothetical protein [Candidatus Micrarchaeota archaeon]
MESKMFSSLQACFGLLFKREFVSCLFLLCVFSALAFAVEVSPGQVLVLSPVNKLVVSKENVSLGTVGPGQTVDLVASPKVDKGGIHGIGGRWDKIIVSSVPEDWTSSDSLSGEGYKDPLQAKITVPANESDGVYEFAVMAADDSGTELIGGNVSFNVIVNVTRDVLVAGITPKSVQVGAGQPAVFQVVVENTGAASDVFEISSSGVPVWKYSKKVFVPTRSQKTVSYEIVSGEERELDAVIKVVSTSSELIQQQQEVHLSVKTSLWSDFKAAGHGSLTFPILEGPVYSLVGFLTNLF